MEDGVYGHPGGSAAGHVGVAFPFLPDTVTAPGTDLGYNPGFRPGQSALCFVP